MLVFRSHKVKGVLAVKFVKLLLPLAALFWIGVKLVNYYEVEDHNEVIAESNQVIDIANRMIGVPEGLEATIAITLAPKNAALKAETRLFFLENEEGRLAKAADAIQQDLEAYVFMEGDPVKAQAFRVAVSKMIDVFRDQSPKYDAIVASIKANPADQQALREQVDAALYLLAVEREAAVEAVTAAQYAFLD